MNTAIIKPQWGPLTIALMVLGFVVWWPLGLAMLAYILWGEMFGGFVGKGRGLGSEVQSLVPRPELRQPQPSQAPCLAQFERQRRLR